VDLVSAPRTIAAGAVAILAVAVAAAGAPAASESESAPAASRVFDRTYRCAGLPYGGRRHVSPFAQPGVRDFGDKTRWHNLAHAALHTGSHYNDSTVLSMGAGSPPPAEGALGLSVNTQICRARAPRIPLSVRGLEGGPPTPLGDELHCRAAGRVSIRVRAVFKRPATLRRGPFGFISTSEHVLRAALAVRAQNGKPLVFAEVFESGRARLFTAPGCVPF
jgi:hypothetical protein